jgi:hypothetical protein
VGGGLRGGEWVCPTHVAGYGKLIFWCFSSVLPQGFGIYRKVNGGGGPSLFTREAGS